MKPTQLCSGPPCSWIQPQEDPGCHLFGQTQVVTQETPPVQGEGQGLAGNGRRSGAVSLALIMAEMGLKYCKWVTKGATSSPRKGGGGAARQLN
jgi:hypothetical protein